MALENCPFSSLFYLFKTVVSHVELSEASYRIINYYVHILHPLSIHSLIGFAIINHYKPTIVGIPHDNGNPHRLTTTQPSPHELKGMQDNGISSQRPMDAALKAFFALDGLPFHGIVMKFERDVILGSK